MIKLSSIVIIFSAIAVLVLAHHVGRHWLLDPCKVVFELELTNVGVGDESLFALYAQLNDNEGNMEIKVDGSPLFESRVYYSVPSGVPIKKTLTIRKGPRMFVNKAVPLTFESACMDDAR